MSTQYFLANRKATHLATAIEQSEMILMEGGVLELVVLGMQAVEGGNVSSFLIPPYATNCCHQGRLESGNARIKYCRVE